ncbi:methyltransferase domain-containing protein [Skermanella pratensis]|uniref:methyltransferase domain-containing protein n=1 Tax=Skermanella pratensis TaxID=2233999 RepID=UPI001787ED59|nr:methyltransferase domain-containing protein [Skermanella pratensis]
MSIQDFALGARAGRLDPRDEEARAERRVREVLRLTQDLRELFPGSGGILDIAVGNAEAVPWYRSLFRGIRLVCLEPERPSPAIARFGGLAHYRRFEGIKVPYAGDSFDVVTGFGALTEASSEHRPLLLEDLLRVLKPGGLLILFEPTGGESRFGAREARRSVRDAGFWNVAIRYGGAIPFLPVGPEYAVVGCKL